MFYSKNASHAYFKPILELFRTISWSNLKPIAESILTTLLHSLCETQCARLQQQKVTHKSC